MYLRPNRSLAAFALAAVVLGGLASPAIAAGEKDKEALKLHDQAMDEDYLAVEFDKAEKKLKDALKKCGDTGCTPAVVGKLHIALGTVYGGSNKLDQAKEEFVLALKADPNAQLISGLTTPELTKAFEDAKKNAKPGKPAKPTGGGEEPGGEEPGGEEPKKPAGDVDHTPAAEQAVNTPVPVYIEIPEEIGASKVTLKYKPFGATKWKTLEMNRVGGGFGVEIPCEDVTTTGDIKYYIIIRDEAGDPAAQAGTMKDPYRVPIKREIEGDEPSLPGKKPPRQCAEKADCPPGLPGCENTKGEKRGDKGWGATCEEDVECQSGLICLNGSCEEGKRDGDDGGGKPSTGKKNVIGVGAQLDLMIISSADNVCTQQGIANEAYYCFYPGGSEQFYGDPIAAQGTNGIQGGFAYSGIRILASYDREIVKLGGGTLGAGAKFGIALGGHPSAENLPPKPPNDDQALHLQAPSFPPIHGEARVWYSFLGSPFEHRKFRPYGFIGFGVGKASASVPVQVCDELQRNGEEVIDPSDDACDRSKPAVRRDLDAYQIAGLNFISAGGGVVYGLTPNFGFSGELKVMFMLPTFGVIISPTIGPVFAF
ncbi:hypothetical protein [Polyangium aurulentum]|uniref:hypothetical protein n=1 Tax=Polyangium aurulentum TaxID=2567896 RepID=UPI0010AE7073|nr:hypothetical protein [Polyangium aurulentum]UQA55876.1 hypothetical protein E8A73_031690 [Polyangium aurulentum]